VEGGVYGLLGLGNCVLVVGPSGGFAASAGVHVDLEGFLGGGKLGT